MSNHQDEVLLKGVLTLGFLAFTGAVYVAYTTPAAGYELSIYRATPHSFWAGIAIGFVTALSGLFGASSRRIVDAAGVLAGGCILAVVAIPLLRSYAFYGSGDALTHLGWAREMRDGVIPPDGIVYPTIHLLANGLAALAGLDLTIALLVITATVFPLLYVLAMPVCLATISASRWAVPVGLFAGILLIPINLISVHVIAHPSSQAILFLPFVIYLLLRYLPADRGGLGVLTPFGAALLLGLVALLLVHPQEFMTFLSLLVALFALQVAYRAVSTGHPIARHRSIGGHVVLAGGLFVAWTVRHERAVERFEWVVTGLLTLGPTPGDTGTERDASLVALGASVEELFLKLFAVSVVFSILAGIVILGELLGRFQRSPPWRNAVVRYFTVGLIPLIGLFVLIFIAPQGDHHFRFHGVVMAVVTILGAVGLIAMLDRISAVGSSEGRSVARTALLGVIVVAFLVMVGAQLMVVHHSPYMFQPNQQVTNADFTGHEVIFEHHDGETELTGLRIGQRRFIDAHFGFATARGGLDFPGYRSGLDEGTFNENLTAEFAEDRYLVIQESDHQREVGLYQELRYTQQGFDQLETEPGIHRIQDNGELRLYRISGS